MTQLTYCPNCRTVYNGAATCGARYNCPHTSTVAVTSPQNKEPTDAPGNEDDPEGTHPDPDQQAA